MAELIRSEFRANHDRWLMSQTGHAGKLPTPGFDGGSCVLSLPFGRSPCNRSIFTPIHLHVDSPNETPYHCALTSTPGIRLPLLLDHSTLTAAWGAPGAVQAWASGKQVVIAHFFPSNLCRKPRRTGQP
jgi:hypothetical protein